MTTIFSFDTTQLPNLEQAGGKALALIEMTPVSYTHLTLPTSDLV